MAEAPKQDLSWAPTTPNMANSQHRFMLDDLNLLETSKHSDVRLICGDRTWKLHKAILCQRCVWFEKALNGESMEAKTKTITITEFKKTPELVNFMIRYIYSGVLDIRAIVESKVGAAISTLVRLWAIADFFLFESLQKDVIASLENFCESRLKGRALISQGDKPRLAQPAEELELVCSEMSSGVNVAYEEFPHAKRCQKVLVDFIHAARLDLFRTEKFVEVLGKVSQAFGHDLLMSLVGGRSSKWVGNSGADYRQCFAADENCLGCETTYEDATEWHTDSRASEKNIMITDVHGVCGECAEKHGYPWQRYEEEVTKNSGRDELRRILGDSDSS